MEARTGDVIASVSKPDFDANRFTSYSRSERENRPFTFAYEPGSVFKIFSMAAILDLGGITPSDRFFCDGAYRINIPGEEEDEIIHDLRSHGDVTAQKIIQYSCNVGMAYASESVSAEPFYSVLKEFGFGSPTGLPIPGEASGQLRTPSAWSIRSKPTIAFGQEISVSAIQAATAGTVFANGGYLLRPHVIHKIVGPDGRIIEEYDREEQKQVVSAQTARQLLLMMETATFPGGTAQDLFIEGTRISAKTGTGQMLDRETGKYSEEAFIASTFAIFPTNDPQYIVYVVIEHPKGESYYGSRVAVPVVRKLIEELIAYYKIPREGDVMVRHPGRVEIPRIEELELTTGDPLPDLSGYSKREILPLFALDGVSIYIDGEGWVTSQTPGPGTIIREGMIIRLELE
jgi:cell division protein FtsI (penicillin-binding protein 3)